jgi:predicted PurR-regulated permease PerM
MARPTPTQSRIFWIALTALAIVALVASVAALIWALGRVLELFGPVLWPLAIAAVLAYLLDPLVDILERRKVKRQRTILVVFAIAVLVLLGIAAMILPRLIFETRELARRIPTYATTIQQRAVDWIQNSGWRLPILNRSKDVPAPPTTNVVVITTDPVLTPAPPDLEPEVPWERKLTSAAVSWLPRALPRIGDWLADQISRVAAWFGLLAGIALVPVYCFYVLLEKKGQ